MGGRGASWRVPPGVMDHVSVARHAPPTRYAQSAGAKIAFQVSGEGPCDLVFVPGLVSHLELQWQQPSYRRFVTALEQACRVIRFDKRGTGLSDPTSAMPGMDERVADLAAVMDAAGSRAAVVFGVSDGGRGAIALAATHPGRVLGLILYGTSDRVHGPACCAGTGRSSTAGARENCLSWSLPAWPAPGAEMPLGHSSGLPPAREWRRH